MKKPAGAQEKILCALLYLPVLWFALVLAQSLPDGGGLAALLQGLNEAVQHPFALQWTVKSLAAIVLCSAAYAAALALWFSTGQRKRAGEEHGSARWGSLREVNAVLSQREFMPLTRHVRLGLNSKKHRRNLNVLVIGGSGASKTRGYAKPQLLCANTNYVVTDPKQELLNSTGNLLKSKGYRIRVFNLVNPEQSDGYNPFRYLRDEQDVLRMVNNLILATTPKNAQETDPFWTKAETALLQALCLMLFYEAPEEEQNFSTVLHLLDYADIPEENADVETPLDLFFQSLERENPGHIAMRQYRVFRIAAGKTARSILLSAAVRLAPFNIPQIQRITDRDELELYSLGEGKSALFAVIPDNDTSMNFLVSLLYAQAFQALYYQADQVYRGELPRHVHFVLDEFAAMPLPGFTRELATMRSRNISASVIIQNMAQLRELYKDSWETIPGNTDTILFLGGNEASTHKYISGLLGRATVETQSHGTSRGRNGSSSTNTQLTGRELLSPDEVRLLDNRYAVLLVRGLRPVLDLKYDLMKHPNIRLSSDGGAPVYEHRKSFARGDALFAFMDDTIKSQG